MARETITVFLRGGLGNQMFQYALGLNLAKKNDADLVIDTTFLNDRFPRKEFTYRNFDLDVFTLTPRFTALSKISEKLPIPGVWLGLDLALMMTKNIFGAQKIIKEKKNHIFDPEVFSARGNIVLYGRWQSEKYFADIADEVRNTFRFRQKLSGEAAVLSEQVKNSNSVSLHVRRGDYVKFENMKKIVGDTDLSYYAGAVSYVAKLVSEPRFFVFSDDIAWCRENLWFDATPSIELRTSHNKKISHTVTYLDDKTAGPKNAYHLELMSLCKHNIIVNSSFSWWGAWLNKNPEKIVVAPARWYADRENQPEVIPKSWIRL